MNGSIQSIQACPGEREPMRSLEEVLLAFGGIPSDDHFAPESTRQLLLLDAETNEALGLDTGTVKENITLVGVNVMALLPGTRLAMGQAEVEITKVCEPCGRMEEIRRGLQAELVGRRGMLARVTRPGRIRRGDPVRATEPSGGRGGGNEATEDTPG